MESRGFISGNKLEEEIYVIEDEYIKCYKIDKEGIPSLHNVMVNFLLVNMIIFGDKGNLAIIYKQNHEDFNVFKKMMNHDFKVTVNHNNFEGAIGLNIDKENWFLVAHKGKIVTFDDHTYRELFSIDLEL